MWSKAFWFETVDRAVKTGAQFVLGALGLDLANVVSAFELDWGLAGGVFLGGAFISLLTSIISAPFNQRGTASLIEPR